MKWIIIVGLAVWVAVLAFTIQMSEHRITELECALAQAHAENDTLAMVIERDK